MADDFFNGLSIVPLRANHSILSSSTVSNEHPWRNLYQERDPPPARSTKTPSIVGAPAVYNSQNQLRGPVSSHMHYRGRNELEVHETIRLCDVEAFRKLTAEKALNDANHDEKFGVFAALYQLYRFFWPNAVFRPVIYRYVDVIKNSIALLEAIHFELFMPDRPDLRFIGLQCAIVPYNLAEGDYLLVPDADLLPNPSFAVQLGNVKYPVVWEAKKVEKMVFGFDATSALTYIVNKKSNNRGHATGISALIDRDFSIRDTLFPDGDSRREHSLVRATIRDRSSAHIYPVEPPLPPPSRPMLTRNTASSGGIWQALCDLFWGSEVERPFDPRSEYLKLVSGVRTTSQSAGRFMTAVHALSASEADWIENRLGSFTFYGYKGDLAIMEELFLLGCRYRAYAASGADAASAGEMKIDESIILKTIMDKGIGRFEECRPLLDCIYGRGDGAKRVSISQERIRFGSLLLNGQQSRAVRLYADNGPRVLCILSPPGSGKTTVAAAMAAEIESSDYKYEDGVQLLLSVQNVAVDNMGAALKKILGDEISVYNMKSNAKLDPKCPAPFDFFDLMDAKEREEWRKGRQPMEKTVFRGRDYGKEIVKFATYEECLSFNRREFEKTIDPDIILSTVEMVLQKMYTPSKLCRNLNDVTRVIIDEASLLTEAALFCIIRRFPQARIVLIGDDKQLPPFMYDEKILGHELAGRPALTVAMKTGRVPVVELNEVYRAPPSLVAPYNRLAYGGKLVSRKAEGDGPLSLIGLVQFGRPQLLLIDVNGNEMRNEKNMSLCNEKELEVLIRLLKKFPRGRAKDIMIICLYKEQKKRLQTILERQCRKKALPDNQYSVLTVDSAQGKESPIVILMTTRTQRATDFFCSKERCNVSVSRQQKALVILGKESLLTTNAPWSTVVNGDDFTRIKASEVK